MPSEYVLTLLVGARGEADARERAVDPRRAPRVAGRGVDVQVLASAEVGMEARLLDDRADASERRGAAAGQVVAEQAHACPALGLASPSSSRISVVLPAPLAPRKPNATPRGTSRSTPSSAGAIAESLAEPARLDGEF